MNNDLSTKIADLLQRATTDASLREALQNDCVSAFASAGIAFPAGLQLTRLQAGEACFAPPPAAGADLSDSELESIAGGAQYTIDLRNTAGDSNAFNIFRSTAPGQSEATLAWLSRSPMTPISISFPPNYNFVIAWPI